MDNFYNIQIFKDLPKEAYRDIKDFKLRGDIFKKDEIIVKKGDEVKNYS